MKIDLDLNLRLARPNQNVIIEQYDSYLRVILKQSKSTPGVLFNPIFLPKGSYQINLVCDASTHNIFGLVFFTADLTEKKIRISRKISLGNNDLSVGFEVLEDMELVPAILASLGQVEDFIDIRSMHISSDSEQNGDAEIPTFGLSENKETDVVATSSIQEPMLDTIIDVPTEVAIHEEPNQSETPSQIEQQTLTSVVEIPPQEIMSIKVEPTKAPLDRASLLFFDANGKFGTGTYARNFCQQFNIGILTEYPKLEEHLQYGSIVFVNGFTKNIQDLAEKYPMQIHCLWHSSLSGSDIMAETPRLLNLIKAVRDKKVSAYWLNTSEPLMEGFKNFHLLFNIENTAYQKESKNKNFTVALPLGSPHSLGCKNILELAVWLLHYDISIVCPAWYKQIYDFEILCTALGSKSSIEYFETKTNPIEVEYYKKANMYVLVSHTDTMPYTAIESLNAGTPFLTLSSIGWAKYFKNSKHNIVFQDVPQLAKAIQEATTKKQTMVLESLREYQYKTLKVVANDNLKAMKELIAEISQVVKKTYSIPNSIAEIISDLDIFNSLGYCFEVEPTNITFKNGELSCEISISYSRIPMSLYAYKIKEYELHLLEQAKAEIPTMKNKWVIHEVLAYMLKRGLRQRSVVSNAGLDQTIFLAIDRVGWAFDNIANELISTKTSTNLCKIEYTLLRFVGELFEFKTTIVAFWWKSLEFLTQLFPTSDFAAMVYDHYSWRDSMELLQKIAKDVKCFGVANPTLKQELTPLIPDTPIFVVKDGVNLDRFQIYPTKSLQTEGRKIVIGWVGNSKIQNVGGYTGTDLKGVSMIKDAHTKVQDSFDLKILDVTTDQMLPHAQMSEKFYNTIDCYVCMSDSEGTPNTVFEALASGIPVITTKVGNTNDVVIEGLNGYFVSRSTDDLVLKLRKLLNDIAILDRQSIRDSVKAFDWKIKVLNWGILLNFLTKK